MKIALMSRWNTACGVSIHAEFVGREWVKKGHALTVFAPVETRDGKERSVETKDEDYVVRNYSFRDLSVPFRSKEILFDPKPLLECDYEIFVVENLEKMPIKELLKVYPKIREKARTVLVIHEGSLPPNPDFYRFEWDRVVCFDERFKTLLKFALPPDKIDIIPFPCHPIAKGDKEKARRALDLPLDKKIIFTYGFRFENFLPVLPLLEELAGRYPLMYKVLMTRSDIYRILKPILEQRFEFLRMSEEVPSIEKLYTYLHASDALLGYRGWAYRAVVSSVVYTCLGSGCPIVYSDCDYVSMLGDEILKYANEEELRQKLIRVFEGGESLSRALGAAERYVKNNSSDKIAQRFVDLFEELL